MHAVIAQSCKTVHSTCVGHNRCIAEVVSTFALHLASMSWTSNSTYFELLVLDLVHFTCQRPCLVFAQIILITPIQAGCLFTVHMSALLTELER